MRALLLLLSVFFLCFAEEHILNENPLLKLEYTTSGGSMRFTITTSQENWVGIGISHDKFSPKEADMWIVQKNVNGINATVLDGYGLPPVLDTSLGGTNDLTAITGAVSNGLTVSFTRRKATSDTRDTTISRMFSYPVYWVIGNGTNYVNSGILKRGYTEVVFELDENYALLVIHIVFYVFAWAICATLGNLVTKFWLQNKVYAARLHGIIYIVCMAFSIAAFVIGIYITSSHFNNSHKILGYFVMVAAFIQPISGYLTYNHWVHMNTKLDWLRHPALLHVHYWLGYFAYVGALIQLLTGLEAMYVVHYAWYIVLSVFYFILLMIYVANEFTTHKLMYLVKDSKNSFRPVYVYRYNVGDLEHAICQAYKMPEGSVTKIVKLSYYGPSILSNSKQMLNLRYAAKLQVFWKEEHHDESKHTEHHDDVKPKEVKKEEKTSLVV